MRKSQPPWRPICCSVAWMVNLSVSYQADFEVPLWLRMVRTIRFISGIEGPHFSKSRFTGSRGSFRRSLLLKTRVRGAA